MRHLFAAALLVSPLMVNAQTAPSAQNMAAMQSSIGAPKMMMSSAAAADRTEPVTAKLRISTGVVKPKLIHTVAIRQDTVSVVSLGRIMRSAAVSMIIDENGKPTDLKMLMTAGPDLDANILEAVSQYRFLPATVSGQKIAMPLNLYIEFQPAQ
ncbi:MAG TPA: energy transducer TonB [Acidobacteriaceae bacterium]|jgi:TonB family protein|nr:energy transducer TonB [Acidobacteriaceae bacterium]